MKSMSARLSMILATVCTLALSAGFALAVQPPKPAEKPKEAPKAPETPKPAEKPKEAPKPADAPKASTMVKALLENDRVKVIEATFKPGEKMDTHSHPDHAIYLLTDGKLKETLADGKTSDIVGKAGQAMWKKAVTHVTENTSAAVVKAIVVELKEAASTPSAAAAADKDPVKVAPDAVKVLLDNERIRVIEGRLKPGGKVAMHSHPASVNYATSDAKLNVTMADGTKSVKEFKAGTAVWSDAVTHEVENAGTAEAVLVTFELKEPAKAPAKK